ncbi:MAG: CCA tRNA nucleotidyltransferase [Pseudomonadota bacterium]
MTRFSLNAYWLQGEPTATLLRTLEAVAPTRVVGGAVRNTLLSHPIGDIDVATVATPDKVERAASRAGYAVHETGIAHGTLTIVADGHPYEVTTLREDVTTDGRRATVRFTDDFAKDAARRDFTMNALYVDARGDGYDPVGGHDDCLARRVRFIGDPETRIREDHLRILRFFRFNAAYGAAFDPVGLEAVRTHKRLIASLPAERVLGELTRLLLAPKAPPVVNVMAQDEILAAFVPVPIDAAMYGAIVSAEGLAGRMVDPALALLGLAGCEGGAFNTLAERLKLPRRTVQRAHAALAAADDLPALSVPQVRSLLYDHGAEAFIDGVVVASARGVDLVDAGALLSVARSWSRPRFPIGGHDLLDQGGEPGPALGARLKRLETAWRDANFSLSRAELLAMDRNTLPEDP